MGVELCILLRSLKASVVKRMVAQRAWVCEDNLPSEVLSAQGLVAARIVCLNAFVTSSRLIIHVALSLGLCAIFRRQHHSGAALRVVVL